MNTYQKAIKKTGATTKQQQQSVWRMQSIIDIINDNGITTEHNHRQYREDLAKVRGMIEIYNLLSGSDLWVYLHDDGNHTFNLATATQEELLANSEKMLEDMED